VLLYVGGLLGIPKARVPALFDTTPMPGVLRKLIDFEQLHRNTDAELVALAVAAASYSLGDSVVFHEGPPKVRVQTDLTRAIRYVPARIGVPHVQASASIPGAFPATHVSQPASAAGWYGDGGIRLNTPIKPALRLGAKRVVIVGLNSSALPSTPQEGCPDIFDGATTYLQALFADPLAQDVGSLASTNLQVGLRQAGANGPPEGAHQRVPYIFVAPRDRLTVGQLAADVFRKHLTGVRAMLRARDMATLGRVVGAGTSPARGELFSLLFFATEFHDALIELGRSDAQRWLGLTHDDGPWRLRKPPQPAVARRARPPAKRAKVGAAA
jgi:NTE family protein